MVAPAHSETLNLPVEFIPQPEQDIELLGYIGFIPGAKEILMMRQVHALEHATIWILSKLQRTRHPLSEELDNADLSGLSTDQGFYVYGDVQSVALHQAVRVALRRLTRGEWHLALHPRCGTNNSVNLLVSFGLSLGLNWLMPPDSGNYFGGASLDSEIASRLSPNIGKLVQQYITTAIPFNLAIESIQVLSKQEGTAQHFVKVQWIEPFSISSILLD